MTFGNVEFHLPIGLSDNMSRLYPVYLPDFNIDISRTEKNQENFSTRYVCQETSTAKKESESESE